jgi:KDO2-lipid IV(A) lauroyltransferase
MTAQSSARLSERLKRARDQAVGALTVLFLRTVRLVKPDAIASAGGRVLRRVAPVLPEQKTGRANLAAAFPELPASRREEILRGVWDNIGRVGAEYAHLDRLWDYDPERPNVGRIEIPPDTIERFIQLRDDGKPALIFAAHLANWELPALAAAAYGLETAILYRQPNIASVATAIGRIRGVHMGTLVPTTPDSVFKLRDALERGAHVAMLVDQHFGRGVDVMFFGRRCKANPMLARLARHFECPLHGTRVIRLPGNRFRIELTPEIAPARAESGEIDVTGTMQIITSVVEGWVREYPEQWLWLHRRWR